MTLTRLASASAAHFLEILGLTRTGPADNTGVGTLALLGPAGPGFWPHVSIQPEFRDGEPDPLDRWSRRVIDMLAAATGGTPLYPFAEPRQPFIAWALRSGRAWNSPVRLLVHDTAGLMISYRGAILLNIEEPPSPTIARPCDTCVGKPCLSACPPHALTDTGYALDTCHAFLDTAPGTDCMDRGCAVRRACPVSRDYGRDPGQSAFHMRAFHP